MRGSRPHNPNADYIIEDGIYFYKETNSGYYLGNVPIPGRKRKYPMRLHVYVWQKYNGEVPKAIMFTTRMKTRIITIFPTLNY